MELASKIKMGNLNQNFSSKLKNLGKNAFIFTVSSCKYIIFPRTAASWLFKTWNVTHYWFYIKMQELGTSEANYWNSSRPFRTSWQQNPVQKGKGYLTAACLALLSNSISSHLAGGIGFKGCMKGFQFQKKDFNLLEEPGTLGISYGCPEDSLVSTTPFVT